MSHDSNFSISKTGNWKLNDRQTSKLSQIQVINLCIRKWFRMCHCVFMCIVYVDHWGYWSNMQQIVCAPEVFACSWCVGGEWWVERPGAHHSQCVGCWPQVRANISHSPALFTLYSSKWKTKSVEIKLILFTSSLSRWRWQRRHIQVLIFKTSQRVERGTILVPILSTWTLTSYSWLTQEEIL